VSADPWALLAAELDRWEAAGRTATLWWRDDDAVADTPALQRLLALRAALDVPLTIAVIPAGAEPALAACLSRESRVTVVQHGFAHRNHAPPDGPKRELGADRPIAAVTDELNAGWRRLVDMFPAPRPVLVPPWNRIDDGVVATLPGLGYRGLSTFSARARREPRPDLVQANTHIDIVDWPGTRGFVGESIAVAACVERLSARRTGAGDTDPDEPTGLLTHHLAHDEPCWDFINRIVARSVAHATVRWIGADEVFGTEP
jgi:hypothetical protein